MNTTGYAQDVNGIPRLEARYELGELLGEGAIGSVYEAWDTVLGIPVAVKIMHARLARNFGLLERFSQEASLASRMMSPHVVKVLGLAVAENEAPCIVFEHLVGETLAARLARTGTLSVAETSEVVVQTARALARAHAVGVVHRDVKPDNIFLVAQPGGRVLVKLLDFGIAEMADASGEASDQIVGTPEYIAPEILFGTARASARSDVYALGVVAFECLTGRCPFPGEHIDDILLDVARGERVQVGTVRRDIERAARFELDGWFDRALHADRGTRFATAREMSECFQRIARIASVHARIELRSAA